MPRITEPTMREELWCWLEQQGYNVTGEITLGDSGRIDILAQNKENNNFIGVEVKNHDKIHKLAPYRVDRDKQDSRELALQIHWQQLEGYHKSGYLDELYFASQDPESIFEITNKSTVENLPSRLDLRDITPVPELYSKSKYTPDEVGLIRLSDIGKSSSPAIIQEATTLSRSKKPQFPRDNEAWVQHYLWDKMGTIREGVLPNTDSVHPKRIDIASFSGSSDPTEIYENQPEDDILGIEAKGVDAVRNSKPKIIQQLVDYLNSGALTRLYLAVPESNTIGALELLSTGPDALDSVGLYTVDTNGTVELKNTAGRRTLRYDGLQTKDGNTIDIIWGYETRGRDKNKTRYSVYKLNK